MGCRHICEWCGNINYTDKWDLIDGYATHVRCFNCEVTFPVKITFYGDSFNSIYHNRNCGCSLGLSSSFIIPGYFSQTDFLELV